MTETIDELRIKCQKPRYKEVGNWMARHIVRDAALYVTWLFLHTQITANQVTLLSLAVGLLSALFCIIPNPGGFLLGALFLQTWYLLDHVDGQVARYRGSSSLTGVFFDYVTHYVVHSFVFLGLGIGAYLCHGREIFLLLGFFAALFMAFNAMFYDAKWKAFYHWLELLKVKEASFSWPNASRQAGNHPGEPFAKKVFMMLSKLGEIHVLMNFLSALAVIGLWKFEVSLGRFRFSLPELFILFYGLLLPFIFTMRVVHAVKNHTIDKECGELITTHV
ncbi:MAG: CDP-alcohol phosphatidyltransferase family protein [Candidatus Omnitrophica bacterium]|nr:CDP-alcohol phosphatidyltransferase family protein [Candidatus Omnitrophota bacterium]